MVIDSIRKYFQNLDSIKIVQSIININYLSEDIDAFSIEEIPSNPIVKKYANGTSVRQIQFALCSRTIYSQEVLQNIENSNFYEKLAEEIETNNDNGILPILENGMESLDLEITSSAYIMTSDDNSAIYQINFRLKYFKE